MKSQDASRGPFSPIDPRGVLPGVPRVRNWRVARPDLLRDTSAVVGVAMIGAGAWMIYPPASPVAIGALLLGGAIYGSLSPRRGAPEPDAEGAAGNA